MSENQEQENVSSEHVRELVVVGLRKGLDKNQLKAELVSVGADTSSFDQVYDAEATKLGLNQVAPTNFGNKTASYDYVPDLEHKDKPTHVMNVIVLIVPVLLLGTVLYLIFFSPFLQWTDRAGANDAVLQQRLHTMEAAIKVQGGRMGSYEGACNDVAIEQPARCRSGDRYFVLDVPLSTQSYYCIDSSGFSGTVDRRPAGDRCR